MKNQNQLPIVLSSKVNKNVFDSNGRLSIKLSNLSNIEFVLKNNRVVEFNDMVARGHFQSVEEMLQEFETYIDSLISEGQVIDKVQSLNTMTMDVIEMVKMVCEKMMSNVEMIRYKNESLPSTIIKIPFINKPTIINISFS